MTIAPQPTSNVVFVTDTTNAQGASETPSSPLDVTMLAMLGLTMAGAGVMKSQSAQKKQQELAQANAVAQAQLATAKADQAQTAGANWAENQAMQASAKQTVVTQVTQSQANKDFWVAYNNWFRQAQIANQIQILKAKLKDFLDFKSSVDITNDFLYEMVSLLIDERIRELYMTMHNVTPWDYGSPINALQTWVDLVKTGGPLDVKQYYISQYDTVIWLSNGFYNADITGNILYGYIGMFVGFSIPELLAGAGLAQLSDSGGSGTLTCFYDHCEDQDAIWLGMNLYNQYGTNWTPEIFRQMMDEYALRLSAPPSDFLTSRQIDEIYLRSQLGTELFGVPYALNNLAFHPCNGLPFLDDIQCRVDLSIRRNELINQVNNGG
jgi:hypothetical protein